MRNAFADEATRIAGEDPRLFLLSGDIGNKLFDRYKNVAADRFLNCGVAEANMIGVAAGLALSGFKPIVYTITPFITSRCFEQIRVDACYHDLPIIIVGVGSGLGYATLGPTHHSCEDIAILRSLPNMTVICPGDAYEVRAALKEAMKQDGPVYIRLGKKGEPLVHAAIPLFEIGKGLVLQEGKDICLLSTGNMLPLAKEVAEKLAEHGSTPGIISMHTVKPLDEELLRNCFSRYQKVVTIEEHSRIGGFGSAVAEWYADHGPELPLPAARLLRIGTDDTFMDVVGEQEFAREYFRIDAKSIVQKILSSGSGTDHGSSEGAGRNGRTTKAAVLTALGQPLELREMTIPPLQAGQVLVDIAYSGVCHTQIGECRGRRGEDKFLPHCLGHEGSGIVREISQGVTKVQPGNKVLISWMKGEGSDVPGCRYPWNGSEVNAGGVTTFQTTAIISENRLIKIGGDISLEQAALLGCAVPTGMGAVMNVAQAKKGQSLAVFGAGGIGLCAIAGAKLVGCSPIIAIDINDTKLSLAGQMGATHTINSRLLNPIEELKKICPSLDFAIEASGVPAVMDQALQAVRPRGGTVVIIGNAPHGQHWELNPWHLNQGKKILGTWGGDNHPDTDFPKYMAFIASHQLDLGILTSKKYPLSEVNQALDDLESGKVARPLIVMDDSLDHDSYFKYP